MIFDSEAFRLDIDAIRSARVTETTDIIRDSGGQTVRALKTPADSAAAIDAYVSRAVSRINRAAGPAKTDEDYATLVGACEDLAEALEACPVRGVRSTAAEARSLSLALLALSDAKRAEGIAERASAAALLAEPAS